MLKPLFIISAILFCITGFSVLASPGTDRADKKPVIITSESLTADNKSNTAIFEGSVVANAENITMHSDKMTVYYDNTENRIKKIHAVGNVKVHDKERTLFSQDAVYFESEQKIIFSGNPKAVEGENVIIGKQIILFINDERVVVENSRVILQNTQEIK